MAVLRAGLLQAVHEPVVTVADLADPGRRVQGSLLGEDAVGLRNLSEPEVSKVVFDSFRAAMKKSGQTIDYFDGPDFAVRMEQVSKQIGDLVEKVPSLKN